MPFSNILGKLKKSKKIAKRAARRMVHGDEDPWRKQCESYGFMLAKSMIMMNSEIHKERMKPKNIYADIGRDQYEYTQDKYIGTGKGWNRNVLDAQNEQTMYQNDEVAESDTLMRATGPAGAIQTTGSFPEGMQSPLTEANLAVANDYEKVGNLERELILCKELVEKAIENLNEEAMENLKNHSNASEEDLSYANVLFKMLAMLDDEETESVENWDDLTGFNTDTINKLRNVSHKIEDRNFDRDQVDSLKEEFKIKNQENDEAEGEHENVDIQNLKEFLLEAFCLIEIVQEIQALRGKDIMRTTGGMVSLIN